MFDVLIIGGGVVGCLIARELSKYKLKVCLLEKESDVAMGASGANSGIVHAGYDPKPGSFMAKFNIEGNNCFDELARELDVPFIRNGSLVLAFNEAEEQTLLELLENGKKNGVPRLSLLDKAETLKLEPNLSDKITRALYAPTAGITCPYSLTIAAAENAAENGVEFKLNQKVTGIQKTDGVFNISTQNAQYTAKFIINAAGVYTDEISKLAAAETYSITPNRGEYLLFDKCADKPNMVIFQVPSKLGKGVLVTPTAHGNLLVGPSSVKIEDKSNTTVSNEVLSYVMELGKKSFRQIKLKDTITQFAGIRALAEKEGDFIIEASRKLQGFIHVAGICSPGLTASPAIAKYVVKLLGAEGLELAENLNYNPIRKRIPAFEELPNDSRNELIKVNPLYGKIVCRCEHITEAEIVECIRRPVGATTLDGVKRRLRAGMGRCQGGFCSPAVLEILAKELNKAPQNITKNGEGSYILIGKTK